jgi:hypothetical protein
MSSPKEIIRIGSVSVSIFENTIVKDDKTLVIPKAVFQVRYKDKKTGEWKSTTSLSVNDIPKAINALQKAYQVMTEKSQQEEHVAETEHVY